VTTRLYYCSSSAVIFEIATQESTPPQGATCRGKAQTVSGLPYVAAWTGNGLSRMVRTATDVVAGQAETLSTRARCRFMAASLSKLSPYVLLGSPVALGQLERLTGLRTVRSNESEDAPLGHTDLSCIRRGGVRSGDLTPSLSVPNPRFSVVRTTLSAAIEKCAIGGACHSGGLSG
jgi:hypothetical protein